MDFINKSKLRYTTVCSEDDPNSKQLAVLESDIKKMPVYSITKKLYDGRQLPIENDEIIDGENRSYDWMNDEEMMVILHTLAKYASLSPSEKDAIMRACDKLEPILNYEES